MPGPIRGTGSNGNGGSNRHQPYYFGPSSITLPLRPRRNETPPVARSAPPAPPKPAAKRFSKLKDFMPKAGMKFKARPTVTARMRRDKAIWLAMMDIVPFFKARHLQASLTEIMDIATETVIRRKPPVDFVECLSEGDGLITVEATLQTLRIVRENHPLSRRLSPATFAELFIEIVKARDAYFAHHRERGTNPQTVDAHSKLAQAVDRFLAVAWFWDGMEIFVKMESEHMELEARAIDNEDTTEEQEVLHPDDEGTVAAGTATVSSLVAGFNGCSVWTLSTEKYEDDVDPITDEEEDEVMGGTQVS